ncbi:MAG TPA: hypothetical protein VFM51_12490 [Solirubrobacterales bacterium]|nr:hypothetical protein [Solirubrobacterales bacterium]
MARESWTDERLDDLKESMNQRFDDVDKRMDERFDDVNKRMDERFDQVNNEVALVREDVKELRVALRELHDDNKATNRLMLQGFMTMAGAIVTGCAAIAGANAF